MEKIVETDILIQYAQVAIFDAEDPKSYPQWETGEEAFVFSEKGIAVATINMDKVKVIVYIEPINPQGTFLVSKTLNIGSKGIFIGNMPASDLHKIDWRTGATDVSVYVNDPNSVSEIEFVLRQGGV